MEEKIQILGIAGSLRQGSYNRAILQASSNLLPPNATLKIFQKLGNIPLFNQDQENHPPQVVLDFKTQIRAADAILFSTPEYNYSYPGVLKNAIDWASRPYGDNAWENKPVAIMSASPSMLGGVRAQLQLRQVFIFLNMYPLNRPEVIIPMVGDKIDETGKLTDASTREHLQKFLQSLVDWTIEIKQGQKVLQKEKAESKPYEAAYERCEKV